MDEILKLLKDNGRLSSDDIAKILKMKKNDVDKKIKNYEKNKVIIGYKTLINSEKIKDSSVSAMIMVKVQPEKGRGFDRIAEKIYKFSEVKSVYLVSGTFDLLVIIEGDDIKKVASFVSENLAVMKGIESTTTNFILKRYKIEGHLLHSSEKNKRLAISP